MDRILNLMFDVQHGAAAHQSSSPMSAKANAILTLAYVLVLAAISVYTQNQPASQRQGLLRSWTSSVELFTHRTGVRSAVTKGLSTLATIVAENGDIKRRHLVASVALRPQSVYT